MIATDERPVLTLVKKAPPTEQEMGAIEIFRRIRTGQVPAGTEIDQIANNRMRQIAHALADMVRTTEISEDDFWKMYDVQTVDSPRLKDFRPLVAVSPDATVVEEDERLTTGKNGAKVFRTLSMSEVKKLPRATWQVPGIFHKVSVSLSYGDANTGKTFVDLDLSLHLAYGMYWQGRKIEKARVLYIYGEGNEGLANRIEAWQKHHGKPDTDNIQFICFPVQLIAELSILCATIEDQPEIPALIVLDTFSVCASGIPENDNVEVARFIACASLIKRKYKTHVHIIHHAGKNGDYRGAAAFKGNVDTMILLSREDNDAPIILTCKKQKDAPYFPDIRLQLEQVHLGIDEDTQEAITSCVVLACNAPTQTEEENRAEQDQMIDALNKNGDKISSNQWVRLCAPFMGKNKFYEHKRYLVQTGRILEESSGPGKPVFYAVVRA